jgi:pimeloyl-ACP methyl ester carboxylesterase
MAKLTREGCSLDYELIDIAAPWVTPRETVVLHHGVGASRELWAEWLPALVDRYRVLRFDMRGHGASTWAERASALTLDELTDDLFAVMDAAGVVQAHLVGESIVGTLALNAALRCRGAGSHAHRKQRRASRRLDPGRGRLAGDYRGARNGWLVGPFDATTLLHG